MAEKIKKSNWNYKEKYNSIFGIPRGGMVVAIYLSHKLNLPIVDKTGINEGTLITDDILDSGNTLYEITEGLRIAKGLNPDTAVCFWRKNSKIKPIYYAKNAKLHWVIFDWEKTGE